jgi:hypothetical protein
MRVAAKTKHQSFKGQFSKFTAIANPKFGDAFMDGLVFFVSLLLNFLSMIVEL